MSFPPGTEMFQFPGFASKSLSFQDPDTSDQRTEDRRQTTKSSRLPSPVPCLLFSGSGFPHSDIRGSKLVRSSPRLFAAYHVLHRLRAPRHPPNALPSLIRSHSQSPFRRTDDGRQRTKQRLAPRPIRSRPLHPRSRHSSRPRPPPDSCGRGPGPIHRPLPTRKTPMDFSHTAQTRYAWPPPSIRTEKVLERPVSHENFPKAPRSSRAGISPPPIPHGTGGARKILLFTISVNGGQRTDDRGQNPQPYASPQFQTEYRRRTTEDNIPHHSPRLFKDPRQASATHSKNRNFRPLSSVRCPPIGGARRDRTDDLMLAKHALSQLSYGPVAPEARQMTENGQRTTERQPFRPPSSVL
jgi:hypothetical protein